MSVAPVAVERPLARPGAVARAGAPCLAEAVAVHAVAWLVAGSAVGLWMATLLVAPGWGAALGPLTYGRWAALHLDLTLYGWLAMPLAGLLLRAFGAEKVARVARLALALWSGALIAGASSWLGGRTSGKLFLDWAGPPAWLFAAAQLALAAVLAAALAAQVRSLGWNRGNGARATLLALLLAVPAALLAASGASLYPPIDPASGGPTGTSLLGSSLGLVALLLATPWLLGLRELQARGRWLAPGLWVAHLLVFLLLDHGDRSNDEPLELLALASVAVWAVLLPREAGRFLWPAGSRRWLHALAAWGALLLASGLAAFAPGILERVKYGEGLVAHAHIAMAGFASSYVALVLHGLLLQAGRRSAFAARSPFGLWQGGLTAQIAALTALGALEAGDGAVLVRGGAVVEALLLLRWAGGAAMLAGAISWLRGLARGAR